MQERWCLRRGDPEVEALLRQELGVSSLVGRLLVNRGIRTPEEAVRFLEPRLKEGLRSPFLFRDMTRAADRVIVALAQKETIAIYGDYDLDGISGSALLFSFLRSLGTEPLVYIPDRVREGYGLNAEAVQGLAHRGVKLLITVDCGGASHREVEFARSLGLDVIVCDHHQVPEVPPPAFAILNPAAPDSGFPFSGLCGAGTAFYLAWGVRNRLRDNREAGAPELRDLLDLVALGTIADLVPLERENRVLVRHGLTTLEQGQRLGIAALKSVAGVEQVTSAAVAFRLAPRLNAAGRLSSASLSLELLTTCDPQRALDLAQILQATNRERQATESAILNEALALCRNDPQWDERATIVLASSNWHPGVIGIVAARLAQRFHRPTALIALEPETGLGRGSVRSIPGIHCYEALRSCRNYLVAFGGHPMAAGFTIARSELDNFSQAFDSAVKSQAASPSILTVWADCEVQLDRLDVRSLLEAATVLEPFGPGNPEPVFFARNTRLRAPQAFGGDHLRVFIEQNGKALPARWFQWGDQPLPPPDVMFDILFTVEPSKHKSDGPVYLRLLRLRPSRSRTS
ncbi:MAG: single-stranded-DNA-specific exonuclease RecJ [Candidatus Binatia bacterium]|nr:MAG: single-stranded-DNA-specific exonuclease RecJ [Candidatus Binatia bacterium]